MEIKHKLKELRLSSHLTQEAAAEQLGVSSQTVSKWERGLLSPDIYLLPKIALLYGCSIDTIFDMETVWGTEHRRDFENKIRLLRNENDWEGIYKAWIHEIELHPDRFSDYPTVMAHVYRKRLLDDGHIERMLCLADYAEKHCLDDDIRNEIYRIMLKICSESGSQQLKEKAQYYYQKLPLLRHSREVYCKCALEGEEYTSQVKQNIFYAVDICECAVRQLITDRMPIEEKIHCYQKAAALYDTVLDGKYGGLYDFALLQDYAKIAELYMASGDETQAEQYVIRMIETMERHLSAEEKQSASLFLPSSAVSDTVPLAKNSLILMKAMLMNENFSLFHERIRTFHKKYFAYYANSRED